MSLAKSMLHLVRGSTLPQELRAAGSGETVVFLSGTPSVGQVDCRIFVLEPGEREGDGLCHEELLDLIFACDMVVTW